MMEVKPFSDLGHVQRDRLLQFLSGWNEPLCTDAAEMDRTLGSRDLDGGRQFLTAWRDDGRVAGTIGVITAVLREKNEVFLAHLSAVCGVEEEVLPALIRHAYRDLRQVPGVNRSTAMRLGLRPELEKQSPLVGRLGFRSADRALEMVYLLPATGDAAVLAGAAGDTVAAGTPPTDETGLRFVPLDTGRIDDYLQVHNPAFLGSPHGGPTSLEEVGEALEAAPHPELLQVGYLGAVPAVALELGWKGGIGHITNLAVAPALQGRGLGAVALRRALVTLRGLGASEVRLTVIESNTRALRLYQRNGFTLRRVLSVWFDGPPPIG